MVEYSAHNGQVIGSNPIEVIEFSMVSIIIIIVQH